MTQHVLQQRECCTVAKPLLLLCSRGNGFLGDVWRDIFQKNLDLNITGESWSPPHAADLACLSVFISRTSNEFLDSIYYGVWIISGSWQEPTQPNIPKSVNNNTPEQRNRHSSARETILNGPIKQKSSLEENASID